MIDDLTNQISNTLGSGQSSHNTAGTDWLSTRTFISAFTSVLSTLLGIIATVLTISITFVIAMELCYINMPTLRLGIDNIRKKMESGKASRAFEVLFKDADKAIVEANTVKTGQSATRIYLGYKVKVIFVLGISMYIILSPGNFQSNIEYLVKPLVEMINNIIRGG